MVADRFSVYLRYLFYCGRNSTAGFKYADWQSDQDRATGPVDVDREYRRCFLCGGMRLFSVK